MSSCCCGRGAQLICENEVELLQGAGGSAGLGRRHEEGGGHQLDIDQIDRTAYFWSPYCHEQAWESALGFLMPGGKIIPR